MPESSQITALLGPTNTGKTHRAVERMLEHDTGMIGLPLRLLAREVYDKVTTRIGESRVALVTGEEKRVPRRPDYWICTVEAMPIDVEVDFLAVDEIQLGADEQRGHVFTERLLLARGRKETWFLGAATMRPLMTELLPTAKIVEHPRFSRLSFAGNDKIARLPPKSALVGFSTSQVYETAERVRRIRGGAAVVLGALSPRTRNAQVAMFQAGEVDYIVATDAIGMGLNLDISHVGFLSLRKFDGKDVRDLESAELAQIAGRAGRHLADGTFGGVLPQILPPPVVQAIEEHRFPFLGRLQWRNADLDYSSIEALAMSLRTPSTTRRLKLTLNAEDTAALNRLAEDDAITARARGEESVRLLWDVCKIPDYRKLLFESHVALLAEVFLQLTGPKGVLDPDWMAQKVAETNDPTGDLDTLLTRIASIRTWTYISNRPGWVVSASEWQERTRAIEDRLSDALHERLLQRFVEKGGKRRAVQQKPRPRQPPRPSDIDEEARPDHPFARLSKLRAAMFPTKPAERPDEWVESIATAPHEAFTLKVTAEGPAPPAPRIFHEDQPIAVLLRGASLLLPEVRLTGLNEIAAGGRARIQRRLFAFARDVVENIVGPLRKAQRERLSAAAKGILYRLEGGLGTELLEDTALAESLSESDRAALSAAGVVLGARAAWLPLTFTEARESERLAIALAFHGNAARLPVRPPVGPSIPAPRGAVPAAYAALGYAVLGRRAIRVDVLDRVVSARKTAPPEEAPPDAVLARWMACSPRDVPSILESLSPAPEPAE
ncbi:MAG: helicase-related protein [Polyangiaceae bacterium]